jgi:hypothetical protein
MICAFVVVLPMRDRISEATILPRSCLSPDFQRLLSNSREPNSRATGSLLNGLPSPQPTENTAMQRKLRRRMLKSR